MARKRKPDFDEKNLKKGELRKLTALRKSLGPEIADKAFAAWLVDQPSGGDGADKNSDMIADAVMGLVQDQGMNLPRGGYIVRRGRGRIIVERAREEQ